MKTLSLIHVMRLRQSAIEAYHNESFERDFNVWWDKMIVYRMDAPIPFAGYWEAVKQIKLRAWEDEEIFHAEGK